MAWLAGLLGARRDSHFGWSPGLNGLNLIAFSHTSARCAHRVTMLEARRASSPAALTAWWNQRARLRVSGCSKGCRADEPLLAVDLASLVEEAGHTVCGVFHNAREALNSATERKPDLAIIDLKLADGDTGGAVAQTLQSMGIRVIILSGHSNVGAGLGDVPHTFAAKPVSREILTQLLGPACGSFAGA
jgi:two-component system, response regulator PdtaR